MSDAIEVAVERGVDFLSDAELRSGEFPSFATPLEGPLDWTEDSSVFVTALCVLALARLDTPKSNLLLDRARGLLRREAAPGPLWRFWTHENDRHLEIPCDADDTSCVAMALDEQGRDRQMITRLLLSNRDQLGRFHTWFIPRGLGALRISIVRNTWHELRSRSRRATFWELTEATPSDVDGVVNANVLRCLGEQAPIQVIDYLSAIVTDGRERECDSWHRNEYSCWYSIADGARRGVPYPPETLSAISSRLEERVTRDIDTVVPLNLALALATSHVVGLSEKCVETLCQRLLMAQQIDGSWERSIFFYGGPKEVFAWGSEAFTTATAIAALAELN